ncbi:response regulator transcription factor [candidate division KSB1 bacterium]|nr:response regulator transcription factor [candidate division KSB1 bacterium]
MSEIAAQNHIISVAVVDDDANVRNGLWWLLNNIAGLRCAGAYASCREFLATSAEPPDILLLDVSMPETSGIDGMQPIKTKFPAIKIIMHSNFDDEDKMSRSRRAGARGYVLKNASAPQLYETILHVHRGGAVWPPGFEPEESRPLGFTAFLNTLIRKARAVFNARRKMR